MPQETRKRTIEVQSYQKEGNNKDYSRNKLEKRKAGGIDQTASSFFEKINKIDNPLAV